MKAVHKVTVLVALQVAMILASFLIIIHLESQTALTGNIVNVAGKNRVLASAVLVELNHVLFHNQTQDAVSGSLDALHENIRFLKSGGTSSQLEIAPLSARFAGDWDRIREKASQYGSQVRALMGQDAVRYRDIEGIEQTARELTEISDALTERLGRDVDALSSQLVALQAALGVINAASHLLVIWVVWRILDRHARQVAGVERMAVLGEFAAVMAHNLKNPLAAIMNASNRIRTHGDGHAVIGGEADRIDRCAARMSQQIDGVMSYVRTRPPSMEECSVLEMLGQAADMVQIPGNVDLMAPEGDVTVRCDREGMQTVFANLIQNAVQAIGASAGHVTVRCEEGGGHITITFENSGPPIPKGDLDRIFEPLYTTKIRGTGLGLAGCRNILEAHGATIAACNDPVTFTIRLEKHHDT